MPVEEYSKYERGNAVISLKTLGEPPSSVNITSVMEIITATLDAIPESHINLFGTSGYIRVGTRPSTGGGSNPGSSDQSPWIRLSYDCWTKRYNRTSLSYTLLHELGHIVDKSVQGTCMLMLKKSHPLECLAIMTRYHGGRTSGPSEHYSDVYSDYFYNEVAGLRYGINRGDTRWRCSKSQCTAWTHDLERVRVNEGLPTSASDLTRLRYDGLFHSEPFRGVSRVGSHQNNNSTVTNREFQHFSEGEVSSHSSSRIPATGARRRLQVLDIDLDNFLATQNVFGASFPSDENYDDCCGEVDN